MIDLAGMRVLVVGLGESGYEAARTARGLGSDVTLVDSSIEPSRLDTVDELLSIGVEVRLGVTVPADLDEFGLLVASPGVPDSVPVLAGARRSGVRVISELELGFRLLDEKNTLMAVTGTNGKTTTTRLLREILSRPGRRAIECGNIGNPLVGLYGEVEASDLLVVEVSSFQLANIESFRPDVAVALNIAPDHFDWHRDLEEYVAAKMRLVENQCKGDFLVYNAEDENLLGMARMTAGTAVGFTSTTGPGGRGIWLEAGWVCAGEPFGPPLRVLPLEEIRLVGRHNVENVMAAVGASLAVGEDPSSIRHAVAGFEGMEHRMELVTAAHGVRIYNDSKATNPHATLSALSSFEEPLVLILGGRNKGLDMGPVINEACRRFASERLSGMVLLGECSGELGGLVAVACPDLAARKTSSASSMDDAVASALGMAEKGGVVLFSPACASFDMFTDYKDRGDAFKKSVLEAVSGPLTGTSDGRSDAGE